MKKISITDSPFQQKCSNNLNLKYTKQFYFYKCNILHSIVSILFYLICIRFKKIDCLVIGDFRSYVQLIAIYLFRPKLLKVVDDGMYTLSLFYSIEHCEYNNGKIKNLLVKNIIEKYKSGLKIEFLTIFNTTKNAKKLINKNFIIKSNDFDCNNFNYLMDNNSILFIGQDLVELEIISLNNYIKIFNKISFFTNTKINYYPHRAECKKKLSYLENNIKNLIVIDRVLAIEDYLLSQSKLPSMIYTFYSTSIYFISRIIPEPVYVAIYPEDVYKKHLDVILTAYDALKEVKGIKVETCNIND